MRNPAIRAKMRRSLIKNELFGKPHIFRIELINTLSCNAKCAFCSNHQLENCSGVASKELVGKVLDEAIKHGTPSINFLGGESLVDANIYDYIRQFHDNDMVVGITTNGILLDEDTILKLKGAGLFGASVTVHDGDESHDRVVGVPGAFATIDAAIDISKRHGFFLSLQTVFSTDSIRSGATRRIIDFARRKNVSLKINPIMPVGGGADESTLLSDEQIHEFKKIPMGDARFSTHCIFNKKPERCPMGRTFVAITPSGEMMPCYFIPVSLGNIHDTGFQDYLDYARTFPIFQKHGLAEGYCVVAESHRFFKSILEKIYHGNLSLPVKVRENREIEMLLRDYRE
jgi:MoaA/NifB/PqqE/SkfB family radical SAM enzyme